MRVAVLISGRGTNLLSLIEAAKEPGFPAEIVLVASNRPQAEGLAHAAAAGIPTVAIPSQGRTREDFEAELSQALATARADLVCLAGFMRLLTPGFVSGWADRLINIHPSLLPAFKGANAHEQTIASGVRIAGCTVHFVRADMDTGPIIVQAAVPVLPSDDKATLAARVLAAEHRIYPMALRWIAEGKVSVDVDDRVTVAGQNGPEAGLMISPAI
jgi:formyltetrahydrofolate-dependent phosphoribosylglycinamide formyltransferase